MALPSVEEVARYLRIEDIIENEEEEKNFLDDLIEVAVEELDDSGIKDQSTKSYGMAIKLLVANYYEERRPQVIGTVTANLKFSLERIILRLKARELPAGDEE
ncbi:phage gp6-like head-tail connector protein [Gracilibacillus salitolerans]|uniref:Phage gp6-like head-tail connector protein n=1 Tax=Gracilibacillus salitolerans TaxID=2663022 RepID=A0A5Q2TM34_9BACI|nr:head-tail connector protein [Gracilibacillus salitolerans]QGH35137.1 phage gp6-like head-tail connector protein [Gracilibacillus salitolerans]